MSRRVTIVGAGNLGIACAARLAAKGCAVTLFTGRPETWSDVVEAEDCNGRQFEGELSAVTAVPVLAADADVILLCLPGNAIEKKLALLKPCLSRPVPVASIYCGDGFFFVAEEMLGPEWPVMGFQRVPFICRMKGSSRVAGITGYKKELFLAHRNIAEPESWRAFFQEMTDTKTKLLDNFYEAAFVNGNVILHPARLMSLQAEIDRKGPFSRVPMFYEEWNDEASAWAIRLDEELRAVAAIKGAKIQPFLEYYESTDVKSLTAKIRSITAFKGIASPLRPDGLIDRHSRFVLADIKIALANIVQIGRLHGISCCSAQEVLECFVRCRPESAQATAPGPLTAWVTESTTPLESNRSFSWR